MDATTDTASSRDFVPPQSACLEKTKLTIKDKVKSAVTDSGVSSLFIDSQFAADMGIPLDDLPISDCGQDN